MSPIHVSSFQVKSHNEPDELRTPEKTRVEIANHGEYTVARYTFQPGWKWSECIKPIMGTDSCQASHLGYAVSGALTVQHNDGTQKTITAGNSYTIPPGHNAWVEGNEPFVSFEIMQA